MSEFIGIQKSEGIGKLIAALAKAKKGFSEIHKSKTVKVQTRNGGSYSYNYAPLPQIIEATEPSLLENGLVLTQGTQQMGNKVVVTTMLAHSSGEFIIYPPTALPVENGTDAKGVGSAITYGMRYARCAALNISADDDDDGSAASNSGEPQSQRRGGKPPAQPQPQPPTPEPKKLKPAAERVEAAKERISVLEKMSKRDKNAQAEYVMSVAIWLAQGKEGDDLKKLAELTKFEGKDGPVNGFDNYGKFASASAGRVKMAYLEAGRAYYQARYGEQLKAKAEELKAAAGTTDALSAILTPTDYDTVQQIRKYADVSDIGNKMKLAIEIAEAYKSAEPSLLEDALTAHGYSLAPFDYEWKKGIEAVTEKFGEIMNTMTEMARQNAEETPAG